MLSAGWNFMTAVESKMDFVKMNKHSQEMDTFTLLVYTEAGRLPFLTHLFQLMAFSASAFQKDFLLPYTVQGYKVKIQCSDKLMDPESEEVCINNILDVDGELVDIVEGEYEVWNHRQLLRFYTSS